LYVSCAFLVFADNQGEKAVAHHQVDRCIYPFDLVLFPFPPGFVVRQVWYSLLISLLSLGGLRSGSTEIGVMVAGGVHPVFSVGTDDVPCEAIVVVQY
jgi:hypothetical protein